MGNKGAFITLNGKDMKPEYTTYEAVVSNSSKNCTCKIECSETNLLLSDLFQPHPNVKPMEYASSLMNMIM